MLSYEQIIEKLNTAVKVNPLVIYLPISEYKLLERTMVVYGVRRPEIHFKGVLLRYLDPQSLSDFISVALLEIKWYFMYHLSKIYKSLHK